MISFKEGKEMIKKVRVFIHKKNGMRIKLYPQTGIYGNVIIDVPKL